MSLLQPHNLPFAAALMLLAMVALLQVFGVGGLSTDADTDADIDGDGMGAAEGLASLIGLGRVPFMVWLALFLFLFAAIGVSLQALVQNLLGAPLAPLLAGGAAAIAALPVNGLIVRPLARILPRDETTAVGLDSLLGRRATIVTGTASRGNPARARVQDRHGHPHHVMLEPHEDSGRMAEGEEVLLVRREDQLFHAVALHDGRLTADG